MKKIATVIAATVVTAGLGFGAASASAATPAPAGNVAAAIQHNNATGGIQQAGFRIYIGNHRYRRVHRRCYVVGYRRVYSYRYHRWFLRPVYRCYYRYY